MLASDKCLIFAMPQDLTRQWHTVHAVIQTCGIIMVIGSFALAMSRFTNPSKHHYHIGISAFALVIAQPFSSIPRLCLHHVGFPFPCDALMSCCLPWGAIRKCLLLKCSLSIVLIAASVLIQIHHKRFAIYCDIILRDWTLQCIQHLPGSDFALLSWRQAC